jgi:mRNA-degrading endonuclease HigB of HigAB toxin-antitoxin module
MIMFLTVLQRCEVGRRRNRSERAAIAGDAHVADLSALKTVFKPVDWLSGYVVFDVGGNEYRIVADVVFRSQTVFMKHAFTHKEYDSWKP